MDQPSRLPAHAREVQRSFTVQAESFEDRSRNQVFTSDARWVFARLPVGPGDLVLDVAAGTGHAALVDLVADENPATAAEQNRLERLRDPSHTRMLSAAELAGLLAAAGLHSVDRVTRPLERPLQPWLEQAAVTTATAERIHRELHDELAGQAVTGFRPRLIDGEL
jgi:hypothetical protein